MMRRAARGWSGIVLAGGDGLRLRALTRALAGDDRPKQFCRLLGGETLLEETWQRARRSLAAERLLTVLTRAHEPFYAPLLARAPHVSAVVQPDNRGTAPAILYALLRLRAAGASGPVAVLPSDHYVSDDGAFMAHVEGALEVVEAQPDLVVLLGIAAARAEVEYGWIETGEPVPGVASWPVYRVRRFWEKPPRPVAARLRAEGWLWNSFVIAAQAATLEQMIASALPGLAEALAPVSARLGTPWEDSAVRAAYARLGASDFSRHVLQARPERLAVLPVVGVGWSDLGDPARVHATQQALTLGLVSA